MDTKKIEELAIHYLEGEIFENPYLAQYINKNDKAPSWDGEILLYEKADHNNSKNLIEAKIPVQVKGKEVKDFSKQKVMFPVEVSDLKNYLKDGGVIYFVVYLSENKQNRIYYKALVPQKIKNILKGINEKQVTKSVEFRSLPKDDTEGFRNICIDFHINSDKQHSFINQPIKTLDEIQKEFGGNTQIIFEAAGVKTNEDVVNYFKNNDPYFYVLNSKDGYQIPINMEVVAVELITKDNIEVSVDGKCYFKNVKAIKDGRILEFRCSTHVSIFYYIDKNSMEIKYKEAKMLRQLAHELEFFQLLRMKRILTLDGIDIDLGAFNEDIQDLGDVDERLRYIRAVLNTFEYLGIKKDIDTSMLTGEEIKYLDILKIAFSDHKPLYGYDIKKSGWDIFKIQNINIFLFIDYNQKDDYISLINFDEAQITAQLEDGTVVPVYCGLSIEQLATLDNIDYDDLVKKSNQVEKSEESFNAIQYLSFNLMQAADLLDDSEEFNKRSCLLNAAMELTNGLKNMGIDERESRKINTIQIQKRLNTMSESHKEELHELIEGTKDTIVKVCAYGLLDNERSAKRNFDKLSVDKQNELRSWPINNYLNF